MKRFLPLVPLGLSISSVVAQTSPAGDSPDDAAAGAAAGLAALGCGLIPCLIGLAIQIALAVWVYRDAKARGMENAMLLTIVTAFTGLLGLVIYLLMRPKDKITPPSGPQSPM